MGMAASQARYLALTARKTNTEWEGQQINQARTALANQSANLFNRLLDLEVPNAPKTTDYTEVQYSFSDGDNESVIDSWQQLSSADPNYNYIVNHYYYANVYTGGEKLLQNPQVHFENEIVKDNFEQPDLYKVTLKDGSTVLCDDITKQKAAANEMMRDQFNDFAKAKGLAYDAGAIPDDEVYGYQDQSGTWHFFLKEETEKVENAQPKAELDVTNNRYTVTSPDGSKVVTYDHINKEEILNDTKYEDAYNDFKASLDRNVSDDDIYVTHSADGNWHFFVGDAEGLEHPTDYCSDLVSYIGNCRATELTQFTKDQAAELAQILKDRPESTMNKYLSFDKQGNLVYEGQGVYTFDMQGKTYFTTEADLYDSMNAPLEQEKPIEIQKRLPYYNATYIKTKIEGTNQALFETDGDGRFTSVKFDDDSVVYALNCETVTDEVAYQDAMNEYLYKKEQYEKTIADINAQTSIIQKEDRTLELRLKQLDTEQHALATEMDAVKKVIKDNVEKTFKTFGD